MFRRLRDMQAGERIAIISILVTVIGIIISVILTSFFGIKQINIGLIQIDIAKQQLDEAVKGNKNTPTTISQDKAADPVTACNTLASDPDDYVDIWPNGVPTITEKKAALESCQAAVNAHPGDARLHYQLGRAYEAVGDNGHATEQYKYSAEHNYRPAAAKYGAYLWISHDYDRSIHFLELSVGGSARGEYDLGALQITGYTFGSREVIHRDCHRGYQLIKHAADKGNESALNDPIIAHPPNCY